MVGVALSTIVIACLIWLTGFMELHGVTSWRTSFAYASLISLVTCSRKKIDSQREFAARLIQRQVCTCPIHGTFAVCLMPPA